MRISRRRTLQPTLDPHKQATRVHSDHLCSGAGSAQTVAGKEQGLGWPWLQERATVHLASRFTTIVSTIIMPTNGKINTNTNN